MNEKKNWNDVMKNVLEHYTKYKSIHTGITLLYDNNIIILNLKTEIKTYFVKMQQTENINFGESAFSFRSFQLCPDARLFGTIAV